MSYRDVESIAAFYQGASTIFAYFLLTFYTKSSFLVCYALFVFSLVVVFFFLQFWNRKNALNIVANRWDGFMMGALVFIFFFRIFLHSSVQRCQRDFRLFRNAQDPRVQGSTQLLGHAIRKFVWSNRESGMLLYVQSFISLHKTKISDLRTNSVINVYAKILMGTLFSCGIQRKLGWLAHSLF